MNFGQRLKFLRLQSDTPDVDEFAAKIGISRATYYNWEAKEAPPKFKQLHKLADALGMTVQEILRQGINYQIDSQTGESLNEDPSPYGRHLSSVLAQLAKIDKAQKNNVEQHIAEYISAALKEGAEPAEIYFMTKKNFRLSDWDYLKDAERIARARVFSQSPQNSSDKSDQAETA